MISRGEERGPGRSLDKVLGVLQTMSSQLPDDLDQADLVRTRIDQADDAVARLEQQAHRVHAALEEVTDMDDGDIITEGDVPQLARGSVIISNFLDDEVDAEVRLSIDHWMTSLNLPKR